MPLKILVVDDSVTIQKVVQITLSKEPYEVIECLNENSMFEKLKNQKISLVLLDYNLSKEKDGTELAMEIGKVSPGTPIIALLGTFDEVDSNKLSSAGIIDKVVKPFESSKFIQKCRSVLDKIDNFESFEVDVESNTQTSEPSNIEEDSEETWVIDNPDMLENQESFAEVKEVKEKKINKDELSQELMGWGMELPSVIGKSPDKKSFLPPRIGAKDTNIEEDIVFDDTEFGDFSEEFDESLLEDGSKLAEQVESGEYSERILPSDSDLDFPDVEDMSFDVKTLDHSLVDDEHDLALEIDSDTSADDFWAVDEVSETKVEKPKVSLKKEPAPKAVKTETLNIDQDMMESLKPMLEEMIRKYCEKTVNKVAWEVIPDLAENLIKKEIKEISKRIE